MRRLDSSPAAIFEYCSQTLGLRLDSGIVKQLLLFLEILLAWNQKMHLVSKKDANAERIARQIIDSLLIQHFFEIPRGSRVLDLGSGAGFPAIPLKLARPDLELMLTESTRKKAAYLQNLIAELRLEQMEVFPDRALNLPKKYSASFDYATAKASGELDRVWQETHPFLKKEGRLITHKGRGGKEEIKRAQKVLEKFPGIVEEIKPIDIPDLNLGGYLVSVRRL